MKLVHFICSGNTFRSRLAEAYLNSKKINDIKSISSGVNASNNTNGAITWYAQKILKQNDFIKYTTNNWTQTSYELIKKSDVLVIMQKYILKILESNYQIGNKKIICWNISDFNENDMKDEGKSELQLIRMSEEIFDDIKLNVDDMLKRINDNG